MLSPDELRTIHEALRPPEGHRLDVAVGTTYSLDLLALLAAPVAFAMFELRQADDLAALDGLAVLEAVRRYADVTTVFCQAGQIAVPASYKPVLTWTEGCVVEVRRPTERGLFHPKSWLLRFTDDAGSTLHRAIVLTRNLTFDRSWDVIVTLDEDPDGTALNATALGPFVRSLLPLAVLAPSEARRAQIESLAVSISRARLAPPAPFQSVDLWPIGGDATRGWPYPATSSRTLLVSPFLTGSAVSRIIGSSSATLISTMPAIDRLPTSDLASFEGSFVLTSGATKESEEAEVTEGEALVSTEASVVPARNPADLHAKLVVSDNADGGSLTRWVVGSANATHHAHHANIELVVVMEGPRSACGVEVVLAPGSGDRHSIALIDLLQPYTPEVHVEDDEEGTADRLDIGLTDLAAAGCILKLSESTDSNLFQMTATFRGTVPGGVEATCRPITLPRDAWAKPIDGATRTATWDAVSIESVTPFLVVTLLATDGTTRSRVVIAELIGAPSHRRELLFAQMLRTAEDFLRYLLLLLGDAGSDEQAWEDAVSGLLDDDRRVDAYERMSRGLPVLEVMLRALARDPASLRHVRAVVDDVRAAGMADQLIPEEFDALWAVVSNVVEGRAS